MPEGGATNSPGSARDQVFTLSKNVNFVLVPVTVKDGDGHLVEGLTRRDFKILEDGVEQKMTFFTSDPFALSAAVVLDLGMPDVTFRKVRDTLPALVGAFGQFDEVAIYTFASTVQRAQDFTSVENDRLAAAMDKVRKKATGRMGGVPVGGMGGPLNSSGPQINSRPVDPSQPANVPRTANESKVLNDAILEAAMDLSRRDPTRRKVLFVISDGREYNSSASYGEVLKVLLSRGVVVYAIGVGSAAIPGYGTAQKVHLPRFGYGDILPKYAGATGGQVFTEFSQDAIEQAYSRVTEEARNQYTIGYATRATPSSAYREIEVLVERPDCKKHNTPNCVSVTAREGYFPLPAGSR